MHPQPSPKSPLITITLKSFFGFEAILAEELNELGYPDVELLKEPFRSKELGPMSINSIFIVVVPSLF